MTTYLSSLIIDPVVRQVRRFSSSGPAEVEQQGEATRVLDGDTTTGGEAVVAEDDSSTSTYRRRIDFPRMNESDGRADAMDTTGPSLSGQALVSSPISSPPLEALAEPPLPVRASMTFPPARTFDTSSRRRQYTEMANDRNTSLNPYFALPERLTASHSSTPAAFSNAHADHDVSIAIMSPAEGPSRRGTGPRDQSASSRAAHVARGRNGSLPADDGQGLLRRRIVDIQKMDASVEEKARLMHALMTEPYHQVQANYHLPLPVRPHSPASLQSPDRPHTPTSSGSNGETLTHGSSTPTSMSSGLAENPYSLTPDDRKPTFVPQPSLDTPPTPAEGRETDDESDEPAAPALGCAHYKRNVKLQCSTCSRWYTCRFCHDEVEDHSLNRRETKYMLCMLCGRPQAAGDTCVECGERTAWYFCDICKLWDDDNEKSIYHCNDCGICRVGQGLGKDFFHCSTCCVCMSISIAQSHKCIERSTDCDCPICGEYMFTSPQTVVFMQCGHSIHHKCYYDHMKTSYRCPICSRSIVNMETQFRNLDRSIESQPMPPQFQDTKALVYCNDCCAKSSVRYHWLGLKCGVCDSYNTAQIQILTSTNPTADRPPPDSAALTPEAGSAALANIRGLEPGTDAWRRPTGPMRRPTSSGNGSSNVRFSPYPVPQRSGRSVSPLPTPTGYLDLPDAAVNDDDVGMETDREDDDLDFWGRDVGGRASVDKDNDELEDAEEMLDEGDADGDGDEDDGMELFGHR